ncbi:TraB/GumN family protein [Chitinophaga filiformis]|uniref:TraB/GumN family protein n=1 Tax=Chitinophaga filiformis TaxID=104663 RepID=A0ABY4I0V9_CHIFI|nr:TraB/GumN family protein [Chitinophaga filiformis]UPK69475.1 TraB/GumN family protein [Chitinophaga filiformis]
MRTLNLLKTIVLSLALLTAAFQPVSAQEQKGLLWEISGKNLSKPAYLFGTIHLYDTSSYELPQAPFDMLDKVDKVYFELDFAKIDPSEMMAAMFIPDTTQYINKLLDAASLEKLRALSSTSVTLNMLGDRLYAIKPVLLIALIMGNDGKAASVDLALYGAAGKKKLPTGGLETVKEEMDAINAISIPEQVKMLQQTLIRKQPPAALLKNMTAVYVKQDIERLLTELNDESPLDVNFNEQLLVKRNIVMAARIDSLLQHEHPLIAVGAGHLGNKTGLIMLLKEKGYTLKNIPFNIKKAHE